MDLGEGLHEIYEGWIHIAKNALFTKPSEWGLFEDDTQKIITTHDLIINGELNNDNLISVKHNLICWEGMDDPSYVYDNDLVFEGFYRYANIKKPGILVKTTKNPKKMPYRMIYGSIAMAKRYFTQPNEYHYGSSLFYVISEETFFKYLRDPPNY